MPAKRRPSQVLIDGTQDVRQPTKEGKMNGRFKDWLIAFLAGLLIAGLAGVVRGDWLGKDAATAVHEDVLHRLERTEDKLLDYLERMEGKIDELRDNR